MVRINIVPCFRKSPIASEPFSAQQRLQEAHWPHAPSLKWRHTPLSLYFACNRVPQRIDRGDFLLAAALEPLRRERRRPLGFQFAPGARGFYRLRTTYLRPQ